MGRFLEVINNTKSDFSFGVDNSKDPDQFAADQDLAKQTGLPVDYVERNRSEAEKVKKQNIDYSKFADMELGASLTDPAFSNLAQDDLENLSYLEKTFKGLGTTISESFKQGAKGILLSAIEDGAKPATAGMMPGVYDPFVSDIFEERNPGLMGDVKQAAAGIAIESIQQNEEAIKAATPEGLDVLQKGIRSGVQSLSQMAPGFAASLATRSSAPMLSIAGVQSYGSAYSKARQEGYAPEQAASYGMIDAAVEVATEKLPADKLLKITGEFGNQTLKNVVKFMVTEAGTEQVATFLQSLNAQLFGLDEELAAADTAADQAKIHAERAAVTLIATVVAGGSQAGIAAGVGKASEKLSGGKQQLQDMIASAEQSNLKRRSPEQFRSFLQSVDPMANVFVPASAFEGVQLDPSNKTLAQVAAQLPQARALNGDVVIPVADVLTDIPADMFSQVAPFVRVEADGVAEIEGRPDMKELIEQVNRESEMATQSKAFQKDLSSQLVATARVRPEEATKYAAVVGARLETLAVDKGMTFDEAVKEYIGKLRVVGPDVSLAGENVMEQAKAEGYEGANQAEAAEWIGAKEKGLDMSQAARMQRAAEQGFDVSKPIFHGTPEDFVNFKEAYGGTYFAEDPSVSEFFASRGGEYFGAKKFLSRASNVFDATKPGADDILKKLEKDNGLSEYLIDPDDGEYMSLDRWVKSGHLFKLGRDVQNDVMEALADKGYDAVRYIDASPATGDSISFVVFDPKKIRSIDAAFDPAQKESSNLLAQSYTPDDYSRFAADANKMDRALNQMGFTTTRDKSRVSGSEYILARTPDYAENEIGDVIAGREFKIRVSDHALPDKYAQADLDVVTNKDKFRGDAIGGWANAIKYISEQTGIQPRGQALRQVNEINRIISERAAREAAESEARQKILDATNVQGRDFYKWAQSLPEGSSIAVSNKGNVRAIAPDGSQIVYGQKPRGFSSTSNTREKILERSPSEWRAIDAKVVSFDALGEAKQESGQFVSGADQLQIEDQADFATAEELIDNGAKVTPDGRVLVFHRTSKENANSIKKTGKMSGKENRLFFSTVRDGQNAGYGEAVVELLIPIKNIQLDDVFGDEAHLSLLTKKAGDRVDVSKYILDSTLKQPKVMAQSDKKSASDLQQDIRKKYEGVSIALIESKNSVEISKIIVPEESRESGIGTAVIKDITAWADVNGKTLTLDPSSDFGGTKKRLVEFYKRLGFVENKGKYKDYEISQEMYRTAEFQKQRQFSQSAKQTETEAFKKWFGDSKVVDENGNPLVVYHGTASDISVFDISRSGESTNNTGFYGRGAYFTEDIEDATGYAAWAERGEGGRNLIPAYLSIRNPVYVHVNPKTEADKSRSRQSLQVLLDQLEKNGVFGTYPDPNEAGSLFGKLTKLLANAEFEKFMGTMYNSQGGGQAVTEIAQKAGFDGVAVYSFKRDRNMLIEAVAFRPEQIKSAIGNNGTFDPNDPSILNQKERGLISISDKEIVIKLTEASNRSTFIHEAGHLFLEIESRIAAKDGISDSQRKMLEWLGVDSFDQIKVEHHEKFARGFEAYAMEGRAPSKDLVEVFRSFARWLKKVYASMKQLDVELNDDIRQFFDRMLAADQAVKEAERLTQYKALFKDAKSAGMTEQEFADYQANQAKAQAKGGEELQSKLLKELTRQTEKWWKEELKAEKEKAAESLGKEPLYQATAFLTGKTKLDGFDVHKMDIDSVKAMLPEGQKPPKQLRGMLGKKGLHPDEVAAMFDYPSGGALVIDILSSPTFNEAADAAARQAMLVKHGDILNDGTLQQEAQLAAHNEERGKLVLAELRALNRRVGKETINRDALKFSAKEVIGRTPLKDVHPGKYRTAEVRSAKEAATALAKKDYAAAAQAKLKQAANFYLYREAMDAKQKEQSWRRYLSAVPNRKYSTKDVHPDYIKQMRLLASVYDFRRNPDPAQLSGIGTWIKAQQDAPDADIAPQVMDVNLAKAMEATAKGEPVQVKNYRDMTLDELQGVYDMVKHLRWVGGQLSENEKVRLQAEYEKVAKNIADKGGDIVEVPREPTKRSRALSGLRQFGQDHLALANQIEELDGYEQFGPTFNLIYQGIIDSSNTELKLRRETSEKVNAIFKEFGSSDFAEGKGEETITTDDGRKFTLSRRGRVMLALYWGSPESRQAIMDGDGLTVNDVNKMLATLTDKELDLVDSIWKLNESFWPDLARVSKAMTGIVPAKVEHVPFAVNGRVMSGGYMRLFYMYDQRDSVQMVDTEGAKITRSGARIATQTKHGARHERVGSGGRKVDLNVNNVFRALDEVIHDISFAETARAVTRSMRNPEVSGAIINHYGKEKYESITSSLEGIIAGNVSNSHPINNFIKHFRTAATYGMLGYSLRNAVQQPVALTNMFGKIGEVEVIGAMYDFIVNRNKWGKFVQERSEFMKNRTSLVNREVAEIMGKISGSVMSSTLKQHAFDLQTIGDSMIAYPGWLAAYRKGLKEFGSEKKAIIYADEAVSATIGSGLMKDMSPLLQGSGRLAQTVGPEMLKSITFMGSYFNVIGRLIYSATKQADFKSVRGVASYTRQMTWYLAAPAILSALLVGQGPDDDESWLAWSAKAIASYGFATVFMLRDLVSAASGFTPSSAWSRALEASIRASKGVYDVATGEKEGDKEDIAKILRSSSYLYPIPGAGQAARTLEYIGSQEAGNEGDFNIYKAIVVGKDRD